MGKHRGYSGYRVGDKLAWNCPLCPYGVELDCPTTASLVWKDKAARKVGGWKTAHIQRKHPEQHGKWRTPLHPRRTEVKFQQNVKPEDCYWSCPIQGCGMAINKQEAVRHSGENLKQAKKNHRITKHGQVTTTKWASLVRRRLPLADLRATSLKKRTSALASSLSQNLKRLDAAHRWVPLLRPRIKLDNRVQAGNRWSATRWWLCTACGKAVPTSVATLDTTEEQKTPCRTWTFKQLQGRKKTLNDLKKLRQQCEATTDETTGLTKTELKMMLDSAITKLTLNRSHFGSDADFLRYLMTKDNSDDVANHEE